MCPWPRSLHSSPCWARGALPVTPSTLRASRGGAEAAAGAAASCKDHPPFPLQSITWRAHAVETDGAPLPAVPSLGTCRGECDGKLDLSAGNSSSPLCKEQEQDLSPTDEPLQFCCGGLCVSLSGAEGQILLIKS